MIGLILAQNHALYKTLQSIKDERHKAEIQRLESKIQRLESETEFLRQELIFEKRKNAE